MLKRLVIASVVLTSAVVGILAGWQFGLAVLLLAAIAFGIGNSVRVAMDVSTSGYEAFWGDDQAGADHWSRLGVNPGGPF